MSPRRPASGWIEWVVRSFGRWGVAALVLLENLFPSVESSGADPAAGRLPRPQGELRFVRALVAVALGSVEGAFVLHRVEQHGE